jgi:hypothetical protein
MDQKNNELQVPLQEKRQLKAWHNMCALEISLIKETLADFIEWPNAQKKIEL